MQPKSHIIKAIMRENGIDGIIASSPENFHYICGFAAHQHTVSRNPAFASAVLSNKDCEPVFAITMDFEAETFLRHKTQIHVRTYDTWVGVKSLKEIRGEEPTLDKTSRISYFDVLCQTVLELNLFNKTIGIEMDYLPVSHHQKLLEIFGEVKFVNVSDLFVGSRSIKTAEEIEMFRLLCKIADEGFFEVSKIATIGISEMELRQCFRTYVTASGVCLPSAWSMFSVGEGSSMLGLPTNRLAKDGDIIKLDGGVSAEFDFYTTDTSRSWIVGTAAPEIVRLKDRLFEAQRLMIEAAKPGLPISELFRIGYDYVAAKYPCYRRGHLGHSISMGPATAEAPYISLTETRLLEPNMILAVEAPCYINKVGGFNIEDMVLITEKGCEVLTPKTPHYL